ncbi:glycoside hydrolase [Sporanaerobium hydrogeniformans]|uniref:Glycoside hydrolase n=1 Tax=Sporanaerobium hydrogeniformans TaxID=3072179 RepID=A0AC61D9E5_9FIRM|nr:TIM-barrel domain-containing protein [Sporanaerobium hydrogeniformans]PHV69642.1 glycoside hydrolase [Sporanaerobium hydrogeniformans]
MHIKNYKCDGQKVLFNLEQGKLCIEIKREDIVRCMYTTGESFKDTSLIIEKKAPLEVHYTVDETDETICIETQRLCLSICKENGRFTWKKQGSGEVYLEEGGKSLVPTDIIRYTTGGEAPVIERVKTVDGERNFIRNLKEVIDRQAYRGKLFFNWQDDEGIYGLGQGEEGIYNYRGYNQYLYQHNMRIPIPFFVSSYCYGILFNCSSLMTFNDDPNGSYIFMDAIEEMDYYFMGGEKLDEVIEAYRYLTGRASLLPKWAFGYIQSKEAYKTGDELVDVVKRYRKRGIPLDCIVQDWNTWKPGYWGEKKVDKTRYPNLKETMNKIHDYHVHTMVSVWPNMNAGGDNHSEFLQAGYLLNDYSTYDAFNEKARQMYWKQANEELFSSGFDAWWCDSTEPFSGPDWGGPVKREPWERYSLVGGEHKHYLDATQANAFALMHAKGIYENQRATTEEKRVVNLTRSGYASSQQYGTILWSGDICATWETLKKQIREGLNFALSGMPYWTLDIGAFFTVGSAWQNRGCGCNNNPNPLWFWQGEYNEGVKDAGYRELYVRWLQYGTFLPMFRSHGTDTPREIWNFGEKGDVFYDTIEKFIKLRYQLMPYIYSLAGKVYLEHSTLLRSLLFDFLEDETARQIEDEFMFGPSLLVCPVTEPMYYESDNKAIIKEKTRGCYLPQGTIWYDYWTGEVFEGGNWYDIEAPLEKMPLFVKGGAIIPTIEGLQYASQKVAVPMTLNVYSGQDGEFTLYEDEGDNYNFEQGSYTLIPIKWSEENKCLIIGDRQGEYEGMEKVRQFKIKLKEQEKLVIYEGKRIIISWD